jgi:hypothetical protein
MTENCRHWRQPPAAGTQAGRPHTYAAIKMPPRLSNRGGISDGNGGTHCTGAPAEPGGRHWGRVRQKLFGNLASSLEVARVAARASRHRRRGNGPRDRPQAGRQDQSASMRIGRREGGDVLMGSEGGRPVGPLGSAIKWPRPCMLHAHIRRGGACKVAARAASSPRP